MATTRPAILAPSGLRGTADRAQTWINTHPALAFTTLSAFYAVITTLLSSMKLLWLDELITYHLANLGSAHAIWHALSLGADPNPPLSHLAVLSAMRLFGNHELALRLPAIAGYWLGLLSLYLFLRRRISPTWALAGTFLSMATGAFEYSYESRSYGIFYGFAMLALLCWSRTIEPKTRSHEALTLTGMVIALALGISTNYFAVLAFLPVAAGEVAFTLQRLHTERWRMAELHSIIRPRIWLGMMLAAAPLVCYRGLIRAGISTYAPHAWNKVSLDQVFDSYTEMVEAVLYPLLALFLLVGIVRVLSRFCTNCRASIRPRALGQLATEYRMRHGRQAFPTHELIAAFFLMLYPFLGYAVASIKGGMLSPRFVIPVCFGFAIAGVAAAHRLFGHTRYAAIIFLILFVTWVTTRESIIGYWYTEQKQSFYKVVSHLSTIAGNQPIAIPDPLMVLTFQRYAPPSLASRIVFPVDFDAIRRFRGEDSPDRNLWTGRNSYYHVPIVPLAGFLQQTGHFIILGHDKNWMVQDLREHRYPVDEMPINTRAGAIGGFTPLMHGVPKFYEASGDRSPASGYGHVATIIPFHSEANQPHEDDLELPIQDIR
ncbi:ArnT family glycosyltransferase [Terriglobus albidus]|uniref:ArnT family glycosyltransferase n=1 Tax=Terriglobus albidus TaxID=1592106 RepID=UPI0021E08C67|nr:glycosyltransferase family 39 protein [Terriglobus albidus]